MKIRMTKDDRLTPTSSHSIFYRKGEEYSPTKEIATQLIERGSAVEIGAARTSTPATDKE